MVNLKLTTDHHSHWLARCLWVDQMGTLLWSISVSRSLVDRKPARCISQHRLLKHLLLTKAKLVDSIVIMGCYSLSVRLEQDLVFELLAFTQLQVEDEAWDVLQLLTEILHFQLSDLGMYEHHELPCTAKKKKKNEQLIFTKSLVALCVEIEVQSKSPVNLTHWSTIGSSVEIFHLVKVHSCLLLGCFWDWEAPKF